MNVKKALETHELYKLGEFDKAGRWYPRREIAEYFSSIRSPSRTWPRSYWTAAKTQKFYKWMLQNNFLNLCGE